MNAKRLLWFVAAVFLVSGTANAALVLTLDDPSTSGVDLRIVDQDSNDTFPLPGIVGVRDTTIGGVPVSGTGSSKPRDGSVTSPVLVLFFQSRPTAGGARVTLSVTDTAFNANLPYNASVTGGTLGNFQFDFFGDSNDQEFGKSFDIGSTGLLEGSFEPQSFTSGANPVGSLTIAADIGFTDALQTGGFQAKIEAVPLPAALPLFASGLAGLGILRWRRRPAA